MDADIDDRDDVALAAAAVGGDPTAWRSVLARHQETILGAIRAWYGKSQPSLDLLFTRNEQCCSFILKGERMTRMDGKITAGKHPLSEFGTEGTNLAGLIWVCLTNYMNDLADVDERTANARDVAMARFVTLERSSARQMPVEEEVLLRQARKQVNSAFADLNEPDREILRLRLFDDKPITTISERYGVHVNTVRYKLVCAIRRLKALWKSKGGPHQ